MKRILFSTMVLFVCISSFAELYRKFDSHRLYHPEKGIYQVCIWDIDTVINERNYYRVNTQNHAIREDGTKVFLYSYETQEEVLVLDMGLQVGDNVTMPNGTEMTVVNIKDVVFTENSSFGEKKTRKSIYLQDIHNPNNTDVWVDSIGSITYGLFPETKYEGQRLLSNEEFIIAFSDDNIRNFAIKKGTRYPENPDGSMPNSEIFTNISFQNGTLEMSGYLFDESFGDWGMFVEEKEGNIYISYYNIPPLCDCWHLTSFYTQIPGLTQDNYEVYLGMYEKKHIGTIRDGVFLDVEKTKTEGKNLRTYLYNGTLTIEFPTASAGEAITLYDTTGRVVATQPIRTGATTATIDITALPAGVYIARLNSGATAKVVL